MLRGSVTVEIQAESNRVFDLIHDYPRRLQWDTMLRSAKLLDGATEAGLGVDSRCAARWRAGGLAMTTTYVSFARPHVAAVKMIKGPLCFQSFAASIRQTPIPADSRSKLGATQVTYAFHFRVRPRFAEPVLGPWLRWALTRETRNRLAALKRFLER